MNYVVIPWERLDDFIVDEQNDDFFTRKSCHGLVSGLGGVSEWLE
jgi:hypothetical protein